MKERFVVIDIETTGHAEEDSIIQIGAVVLENNQIIERFSSFVYTDNPLPPFIKDLTGIDEWMLEDAPLFEEIAPKLLSILSDSYFVAHNVDFDLSFIQRQLLACGYDTFDGPVIDTVELARLLYPTEDSYKLSQLAEGKSIIHERPHQADSDAEVTGKLLALMLKKLSSFPIITLQQLMPISERLKSDITTIIESIIREKLHRYEDDERFDIYRSLALRKQSVEYQDTDEASIEEFSMFCNSVYQENGKLANVMNRYENRAGQQQMSETVFEAFNGNQHALIEAGTGTGKSMAYLLPAIFFSKYKKEPVIISTYTIPLQQQLIDKDIPMLQRIVPFSFKTALLKGRSHYLCLHKFEQSLSETEFDHYDTTLSKGQILVWLTETIHGDVEEINLPSGGKNFWHLVKSDPALCTPRKCSWGTRCFYHRARTAADKADIIITNHALLMTDTVHEQHLLPDASYIILDEAHHLEDAASDRLGLHIDYVSFTQLLNRIGTSSYGKMSERLQTMANQYPLPPFAALAHELDRIVEEAKNEMDELFRMIRSYVLDKHHSSKTEIGRISYRFFSHKEEGSLWAAILECANRTVFFLRDLLQTTKRVAAYFEPVIKDLPNEQRGLIGDFVYLQETIQEEQEKLSQLLLEHDPDSVYWIEAEVKGAKNATFLYNKPVDVSEKLADTFFANKKSVVLTSATLTVKHKFTYTIDRLGLYDFNPMTLALPSPFPMDKQAKLFIPTDVESIKGANEEFFIDDIAHKIKKISNVTNGKMLVLFTSFDMLRKTHQQLKTMIDEQTVLIAQGINSGSRAKLIKTFKQHQQAILFGTSSFWEGIDIPGDDLSCLVIVRLPFTPPDQPVIQAKCEKLEQEGKNPFYSLSLPQAIIRFKQGVGRLIRTSEDRGVIIVLDKRLAEARYGSMFIKSLPPMDIIEKSTNDMLADIKHWLEN